MLQTGICSFLFQRPSKYHFLLLEASASEDDIPIPDSPLFLIFSLRTSQFYLKLLFPSLDFAVSRGHHQETPPAPSVPYPEATCEQAADIGDPELQGERSTQRGDFLQQRAAAEARPGEDGKPSPAATGSMPLR